MKVFYTLLIILLSSSFVLAEETLFSGDITHGGYGGPSFKVGKVYNSTALWIGGGGGWIINHQFVIGGAGYGMVSELRAPSVAQPVDGTDLEYFIDLGYGGLLLQYIANSDKLVHYTIGALIGAGGISYSDRRSTTEYEITDSDAFMVIEPGVDVVLNMTRNFRLAFGVKYLYVSGLNSMPGLESSDISSPQFHVMLKFGTF